MEIRKRRDRIIDFLRDPAIRGFRDLLIIIPIVAAAAGAAIVAAIVLVQSQVPAVQEWLTDTFIIERWMYLLGLFGMSILVSMLVVQWRILLLISRGEVLESDDDVDFKPVHGVLWRFPPPANKWDTRWNPKCPEHRVTMHVYTEEVSLDSELQEMIQAYKDDDYMEEEGSENKASLESRYFFDCRGSESGDDNHTVDGPFVSKCLHFDIRKDVYDRIMGRKRLSADQA
ncbi:MAG: hypothetical protein IIA51_08685 [Chloroflexi bacterium]|nr:hypothetical protein [Chloroflexota bacterium]